MSGSNPREERDRILRYFAGCARMWPCLEYGRLSLPADGDPLKQGIAQFRT